MEKLLVATTNRDKLREIAELLCELSLELVTLADYPPLEAPEEMGTTFAENARAKALYYARATGCLTVAEDSGLEIDELGGAPGVQSARFGGEQTPYPEKFALIYEALRNVPAPGRRPGEQRKPADCVARFVCALAVADGARCRAEARILFEARGTIEGRIAPEPRGTGGFGYDPIFFYPPFGCTLAEAVERKSSVSHRGNAFRHLRSWLSSQVLRSSPPP